MAEADAATIAAGTPGELLMERAGRACLLEAVRLAGGIGGKRFVVLAGPGNNGGDGFVIARLLAHQRAWVRCYFVGDVEKVSGDAALNLERLRRAGLEPRPFEGDFEAADVVIDAIFGTGFKGALEGEAAVAAIAINRSNARVLAVDIPSGVNGTSGEIEGTAVRADKTVAIQAIKPGLLLEPGSELAGDVVCKDIGIDTPRDITDAYVADPALAVTSLPMREPNTHKWAVGSVLVIAGSVGMSGAPAMVSLAAFKAGAGLVVCATPGEVQPLVAEEMPELMTIPLASDDGKLTATALDEIEMVKRFGCVALGPGIGRSHAVDELVHRALVEIEQPLVLDADGLNAISGDALRERTAPTVITPHDGEFARLGGDLTAGENRIAVAKNCADDWGVTLLLKGSTTIVATPGRSPKVCTMGGPELATAGSGDTLTGTIAAFVARGVEPHDAAVAAACVHQMAGKLAASAGEWITATDVGRELGFAEFELRTAGDGL